MDCRTARQLLDFRPQAAELDAAETAALDEHLANCPECENLAHLERRVDDVVGQAMGNVAVPNRLRASILNRLSANRREDIRREYRPRLRIAAAAALLICSLAAYGWWTNRPRPLNAAMMEEFWTEVKQDKISPPDAEAVRRRFKEMGVEADLPPSFRYNYLTAYGLGQFQGQKVPQMVFVRDAVAGSASAQAQILILSSRHFNADNLAGNWSSEEGYPYRVEAFKDPALPQVYVIFHTGEDFSWLQRRDEEPAL